MKREKIIEFLRDCPVYTRLYSPLYGYCEFLECSRNFIFVRVSKSDPKNKRCSYISYKFTEFGKPCGRIGEENEIDTSECMLFPSHTYKSWKNWQVHLFKDGDIIYKNHPLTGLPHYPIFKVKGFNGKFLECIDKDNANISIRDIELKNYRYATKEEIKIFYDSQKQLIENQQQQEKANAKTPDNDGAYQFKDKKPIYYNDLILK